MALNKKIRPFHNRVIDGAYDNLLRTLPLFTSFPALVLVAVDLHRYKKNSTFHHVYHNASLVLDAIALALISFNILWALTWGTILRYRQITPRPWIFYVDLLLLMANMSLGDTTLSMRSSSNNCTETLGECTSTALSMMSAVGAFLIISSIPQHILCTAACKRWIARRRRSKRINRDIESAEDGAVIIYENEIKDDMGPTEDGPGISYENEITREMGPTEDGPDIIFDNEIK